MSRIAKRFATLKAENRAGLVSFIMANDPDRATCQRVLNGLPAAGADLIELGMPFTDPMADGPAIQLAAQRALAAGGSLRGTLEMVAEFRKTDKDTPVILMGYYNPIYAWGAEKFAGDAALAGVDGLIIVDLPPEEAGELVPHLRAAAIDFIVLTTPTSDDARLPVVLANASGFVYYVSIAGITGTGSATKSAIEEAVSRIRHHTDLPVCVGFGIKTPDQAAEVARLAEGAVVGSAIVSVLAETKSAEAPLALVKELAVGVREARR
ncbi:tryptophan synthase subunit alpha [Paramagnetospirillum kuznetsovii]|uniref:Tryptophan synthase alpha chain n=1 Tax=Paramagnetospirillum kuznetsovii TaxID=2053833 RepID=A0A364P352_9PROT|nr:tryptophan synthase subunit alpha [Paramagnetospirillum kuznetsovii]RAU23753.1 tryptophan synthase subunit alpha [Paramagnetospirillum kuznetsovii]